MRKTLTMPSKKMLATFVGVQVIAALFVIFREHWVFAVLPHLGWIVLPLTVYFVLTQGHQRWNALREKTLSYPVYAWIVLTLFAGFAFFIWQVAALSLTLVQPYIANTKGVLLSLQVAPHDLLGWSLNIAVSLWLLIVCMATCINAVKSRAQGSLLQARFQKLSGLAFYAESLLPLATLSALYVLSFLLILQLCKSISTMLGYTQVTIPYLGSAVFILVMYLFYHAYRFSKHHREEAKNPKKGLAYLLLKQCGFYLLAWTVSIVITSLLPERTVGTLSEPWGLPFITPERYVLFWQMAVVIWGLCLVPVLSLLLARYSSGLSVLTTVSLMWVLPLGLYLFLQHTVLQMTGVWQLFTYTWTYDFVPLTNHLVLFKPSLLSITAGLGILLLLAVLKYNQALGQAWVGIMPVHAGRRILYLKRHMARWFSVGVLLCVLYLMMGSIALAMVFAGYLLPLTMYMILHLGQGLSASPSLPHTPLTWKGAQSHGYF